VCNCHLCRVVELQLFLRSRSFSCSDNVQRGVKACKVSLGCTLIADTLSSLLRGSMLAHANRVLPNLLGHYDDAEKGHGAPT
jgi:hypothetical protein